MSKLARKRQLSDNSVFSANHGRAVKHLIRLQEEKEAEQELKEFYDNEELHPDPLPRTLHPGHDC